MAAAQAHSDLDDLIFVNEKGEVTETTRFNLFIRHNGKMITPPLESGLLPGTLRRHLLQKGTVSEEVISVRGMVAAELDEGF